MEIRVKDDSVEIEGYVNAVERNSKTLRDKIGSFIERICKGAFGKALKRNDDVHILLNHDWKRDLGSQKAGNLELKEDNIGLKAKATITDPDVVKKARDGELVGWSFGFMDRDVDRTRDINGLDYRVVKDLDLYEVSILDKRKVPAYDGTLIEARDDGSLEIHYRDELGDLEMQEEKIDHEEDKKEEEIEAKIEDKKIDILADKIASKVVEKMGSTREETQEEPKAEEPKVEEVKEEPKQQEEETPKVEKIDYSEYENMINEMKEE